MKRKDLRKIKRDKEEKRKRSEAGSAKEEPSPPFLSRIFGSRRSGRRLNKKLAAQPPASLQVRCDEARTEPPLPAAFTAQVEPAHPAPKPRTVFLAPGDVDDDSEMEVDWRVPPQPYSFAPPPSRVLPPVRQQEEWVEDRPDQLCSSAPLASPRLGQRGEELRAQPSPLPARHRIHIAGLSPYQRRVARIGNGLEISDEEWDDIGADASPPARLGRYEPDGQNQSDLSLDVDNNSHAMSVNHDFILKRATANHQDAELGVSEHMRRSFDILKFSNEGLKKTIDSLNNQRMSQSSDQLHLSDSSVRRESTGSMSNSTSSLNISDADDLADLDGSGVSLDRSSGCEKDVRDDVLIIDDHKETIDATVWPAECRVQPPPGPTKAGSLSPASKSGADSPTDKSRAASLGAKSGSSSPVSKTNGKSPPASPVSEAPSSQGVPEFLQVHLQPVQQDADERCEDAKLKARATWEPRQLTDPTETPMFSMSVRVQNPPDAKFRRSPSSGEACHPSLPPENPVAASRPADDQQQQPPRPFIASVRMRTEEDGAHPAAVAAAAATSHHLMARLSARPWQSKEDKERQNKVLLDRSQAETTPPDGSADNAADVVEMPPEVKLRPKKPAGAEETSELLKVFARRSLKLRDSRDLTDAGAVADQHPSAPDAHAKSDAFGSIPRQLDADAERHDPPKERASSRWQSKPPVAARASLDNPPHPSERKLKRPSKSVPLVRHHDPHASLDHADQKSSLLSIKQSPSLLICREPPSGASSPASSDSSPTGAPAPPAKFFEPDDRVRPEAADAVWKKQPRFGDRFANSQPAKSNVEVNTRSFIAPHHLVTYRALILRTSKHHLELPRSGSPKC